MKFYFKYLAQLKKPVAPTLVVGRVVHAMLQEWNRARWKGDYGFKDILNEVFNEKWEEEQSQQEIDWDGKESKENLMALSVLELYLDQTPIEPDEKPMAMEVMLEADVAHHGLPKLIGIVDLITMG